MTRLFVIGALMLVAPAIPASAAEGIRVPVSDLRLDTPAGRSAFERRVDRAAHAVCDQVNERFGSEVRRQQRACRAAATADARDQITRRASPVPVTAN